MPITTQQITAANTHLLGAVAPDVFDHDISRERLAAYVADARHAMFVAIEDAVVVGQIRGSVHLQPDRAPDLYIDNLGTAPSHQRRGIAATMMKAMLAWGAAQGCTYAWVATETDNADAIGFYGAQHFEHSTIAMFALEMD
jgi:ribosomal protein S18 acetylase RimI-like enzyme